MVQVCSSGQPRPQFTFVLMANLIVSNAIDTFMQSITKAQMRSAMDLGDGATKNVGNVAGTLCAGDDFRLSDARTPTAHASTHAAAGSDPLTLSQSQITNLVTDLASKVATGSVASLTGITITGSARRITGDFSDGTFSNRVLFQTSIANSNTSVGVIPSGTAQGSTIAVSNSSNADNAGRGLLSIGASAVALGSSSVGSGSTLPIQLQIDGVAKLTISTAGNTSLSGILSVGAGGTGTDSGLLYLEGSNASSYGAAIRFKRNGGNTWQVGNRSAVIGGASNDLVFYSGDASATIATLSSTGLAVTGNVTASKGVIVANTASTAGDSNAIFYNLSATGYGLYTRGGGGSLYSLSVQKYDGTQLLAMSENNGLVVVGAISATGVTTSSNIPLVMNATTAAQVLGSFTGSGPVLDYDITTSGGGAPAIRMLRSSTVGSKFQVMSPGTGTVVADFSSTGLVLSGSLSVLSSSVGSTAFSITNNSVGGHQFTWSALGSGTGTPGYLQLADNTAGKTLVSIGTDQKWAFGGNITAPAAGINGIINVKIYGAVGDGVTNDTSAIATAIAALPSSNGVLYFPSGTYKTTTMTITGKTGLTIYGDGVGVSVIKVPSVSQVLNISTSTRVNVFGLTFDGSATVRSAGQHAVVFDASQSSFCDNEIINSGEFSLLIGSGATTMVDMRISRNLIRSGYADGINLQNVQKFVVANNVVDGVDDDLIAIGYNGSGACSQGTIVGNTLRARNDLATAWGRGIWVGQGVSDVLIADNAITAVKQTGIYLNGSSGSNVARVIVRGNYVTNAAINSGHGIAAYDTSDCVLDGNVVENLSGGANCIDIATWKHLTISGGVLTQQNNLFARGIHADEGTWTTTNWTNLVIKDVTIRMEGASTNSCVYLSPHSSITMTTGSVINVTGKQVVAGDYITVAAARQAGTWKVGNNVTLSGNAITSGGTLFNNN